MDMLTYDTVARFSMVASLLLFIALFVFVLIYAFWISNREHLEAAQRAALDLRPDNANLGGPA